MIMSEIDEKPNFTQSFQALEAVLGQLRQGAPSLEEALSLFEQGVHHVKICQSQLTQAKGRVEELVQSLQEGGQLVTQPFEDP